MLLRLVPPWTRAVRHAFFALVLLPIACATASETTGGGDDDDDEGGAGGAGGEGGGGGGGAPVVPRAAFAVSFLDMGTSCNNVATHTAVLGTVTATDKSVTVGSGEGGALVSCTMTGTGPYGIVASAVQGGNRLDIEVTMDLTNINTMPALGKVSFQSTTTVVPYASQGSTCFFWFDPMTPQGVQGKNVWLTFKCDTVSAESGDTCALGASYVAFENCGP